MSTAIYIAAMIIASAINPGMDYIQHQDAIGWFFTGFVVYDLLNLGPTYINCRKD